jgi:uncharacterized protein YbjT (DUF2867 family)
MENPRILLFGATGAVGGEVLKTLLALPQVAKVTAIGRRKADIPAGLDPSHKLVQETADLNDPAAYSRYLKGHSHAICTLGVGQPSKMSRDEFVRIDRDLVLTLARACREAGVAGFSLLGALGANAHSSFFYPKLKGQLEEGLKGLGFERLRLFRPSMILTPTNRYGSLQGFLLRFWPLLNPVLVGSLSKARGIRVEELGRVMALSAVIDDDPGVKILYWADFKDLIRNNGDAGSKGV